MNNQTAFMDNIKKLEDTLAEYFVQKAPAIPANIKDLLVSFAPILSFIGVLVGLPAILMLLGLGSFMAPFAMWGRMYMGAGFSIGLIFLIVSVVLQALAIPELMKRTKKGWNLIFYSILVTAIQSLIQMNIFELIIGTGISLYLAFQVREYYK